MNIIESIQSGFKNAFDFKGRAFRSEYNYWTIFSFLLITLAFMSNEALGVWTILIVGLPSFSISMRRLHDLDRTGWHLLWSLTFITMPVILIYLMVKKGTDNKNSYGENPLKNIDAKDDNIKEEFKKSDMAKRELELISEIKPESGEKKEENIQKDKIQMSKPEKLFNEFPHISEEPKEFNFGTMAGYVMMMLSVSFDEDGNQDELEVIFEKLQTMWGVPFRMSEDQANEIWTELQLWYNALTDLPNHGSDEKYKIVEWMIESVKNPTGKIEDDIADMILQETSDLSGIDDKDWAPSYMLQALIDVANANNKVTGDEKSFLIWCAEKLGYEINFNNLTFSKSNEEQSEPEYSEDETSDSSSLNVLDMSGSSAVQDLLAKVQAIIDEDPDEEEAYGVLPSHWENKHIICCLLNHMMVIDNKVDDNERASMNQTIQKFTAEGIDLSGNWDDVDDYLVSLHGQDYNKYEQTVIDCQDYVNDHFEDDQKFAVLSAIMNMAAADRVLEDSELKMLKRIAEKWSVNYESMVDAMKADGAKMNTIEESDPTEKQETQKEEPSVADSSEETLTEPAESSGDPVEDFRSFLANKYPTLKLPKGKKYVEFPIGKGILVCCMVKTNGVNVYLYSGGRVPAREVFNKLNELGVSGKVINDKYTITPMPGSRNPNVVRIDLLILYDNRDLNNQDLRNEVLDVYSQLIELCMPLNPDVVVQKETQNNDPNKTSKNKLETAENKSGSLKIVIEGRMHQFKLGILQDELREGLEQVIEYLDDYDTVENLICALWYGKPSEIFEPISKESWDQISSNYPVIEKIQGTSMGGVWEEFWIFYEPWVIDNDNQISIYLNDEILVSGEIGSLFEKTCDPGYKRDNVKEILGIDLTPQEVMGKINCKVSYPFKWDEEIAELMGDKEEFGSEHVWNLSKYGWQLDHIDHSVFKQKIKEVEYGTKRMQVTEYGKYKIISDEIDVENFDWQRLVFLRNSIISDFVPNSKEYALSHVLYAFEDKGLEELFFTIHDFSILDVSYDDNWPTDE